MMNSRARFERQTAATDAYGNTLNDTWATLLTVWARYQPAFGRESVEAGRLESTSRATVTIRRSTAAEGIKASDRIAFTAGPQAGKTVNIRSIMQSNDRAYLIMTVEEGVVT